MNPQVSVLIPVYNAERTLAEALDSIAVQTLRRHEVVLVLNGCTDDTEAIARAYSQRDPRVRILTQPEAGIVPALNAGLKACKAPLVARLDADDLMLPTRLQRQYEALREHPEWSLVSSQVRYGVIGDETSATEEPLDAAPGSIAAYVKWLNTMKRPGELRRMRFVDSPVAHPSVCYRRDIVRDLGGYRLRQATEDYDLWLRMFGAGLTFGKVDEALVVWRDRPQRLTRTDPRCGRAAVLKLRHQFLVDGPLSRRRCRIWTSGPRGQRHVAGLRNAGATIADVITTAPQPNQSPYLGRPAGDLMLLALESPREQRAAIAQLRAQRYRPERDFLLLR